SGYGNTVPLPPPGESIGATPGTAHVHADIEGLEPNTVYHYRLVGINAEGTTRGADLSLTTQHAIKSLATESPTELGPASAVMNGSFDPDGYETHYYFEWGQTLSYGHLSDPLPGADAGSTPGIEAVSSTVTGLNDYTVYHYRLVAVNSFGTTVGEDIEYLS